VSGLFHLIQRGRFPCFSDIHERLAYLDLLVCFASHCECVVHAYALMPNHAHVLLTADAPDSALDFGNSVDKSCDGQVPELELRPIHARRYLLACMRYIELNPVRAHMVGRPADYRWSSYRANALGWNDPAITPHALYYALGRSPEERRRAYARFVGRNRLGAVSP